MNYSRLIYFKSLISSIIDKCFSWCKGITSPWWRKVAFLLRSNLYKSQYKQKLLDDLRFVENEINSQVQKIYSDQDDGYWPITDGDTIFIEYMNEILKIINDTLLDPTIDLQKCRMIITQLEEILHRVDTKYANSKIKAVFFIQEIPVWPSFESVYEAFVEDPTCEAHLVYIPFEHLNKENSLDEISEYTDKGLPALHCQDYNLSTESPDIVFFIKPYDSIPPQFYIDETEKIIKRSVYIPYGIRWVDYDNVPLLRRYHYQLPFFNKVWKIFNAPNDSHENYIQYGNLNGENVELIGHPRYDSIHKLAKMREDVPLIWKQKMDKRKVFLWNTHFINRSQVDSENEWATFELFGKSILSYFKEDKEIMLLWRPHPLFFNGLVNSGIMTTEEIKELKTTTDDSENIIIDDLGDYRYAFSVADALISDASSLLSEFLEVDKPILFTHEKGKESFVNKNQLPAYYKASKWEDIKEFIEIVKTGDDHKKNERMEAMKYFGINPKINIGKMVKEICITDLIKEETSTANVFN